MRSARSQPSADAGPYSPRSPQAEPFCGLCSEPIDAEEISVEAFEITGFLTCTDCLESLAEQGACQ